MVDSLRYAVQVETATRTRNQRGLPQGITPERHDPSVCVTPTLLGEEKYPGQMRRSRVVLPSPVPEVIATLVERASALRC